MNMKTHQKFKGFAEMITSNRLIHTKESNIYTFLRPTVLRNEGNKEREVC
jgi:hypothetical protein